MLPLNADIEESILLKSKRDQFTSEIRKKKNEDILNSKRIKFSQKESNDLPPNLEDTKWESERFIKLANELESAIFESSVEKLEKALKGIRLAVSCSENPRIDLLYQTNILPKIAQFLKKEHFDYMKVQTEASWIMANVVSSESKYTKYVVEELNGINCMLTLLESPSPEVKGIVVWAIGNISAETSTPYAERFLRSGVIPKLIELVEDESLDFSIVKTITWVFSNLAQAKSEFELIAPVLPVLESLMSCNDEEVFSNILWTLETLSGTGDGPIFLIMKMSCLKEFVSLARCKGKDCQKLRTPALRMLGNCIATKDAFGLQLAECGIIPCLSKNIKASKTSRKLWRKDALWSFSNLITCGIEIIEEILKDDDVLDRIFDRYYNDPIDVKSEAMKCMLNLTQYACYQQIKFMVDKGLIKVLLDALDGENETDILIDALETFENVLKSGADEPEMSPEYNEFLIVVEQEGGTKIVEKLQNHLDERVTDKVQAIIDAFFVF